LKNLALKYHKNSSFLRENTADVILTKEASTLKCDMNDIIISRRICGLIKDKRDV
tara:strand:+ start:2152 stop:2316 length:165 start_codon:yes stop_codon:yes gene_type:complete